MIAVVLMGFLLVSCASDNVVDRRVKYADWLICLQTADIRRC